MYTLRSWASKPLFEIEKSELARIKRIHTYTPKSFSKKEPDSILGYRISGTHIFLPIAWSQEYFQNENSLDLRYKGPVIPQLAKSEIVARDEAQQQFFDGLFSRLKTKGVAFGNAQTGSGKTVSALKIASSLKLRTLIVVPEDSLIRQWKLEITKHLGLAEDHIGIIQSDKCEYNKPISIAMVHSLVQRRYPREFYNAFGFISFDECDVLGARSFSKAIGLFPAKYKLALSATWKRKDGCQGLFINQFGSDFVVSGQDVMPLTVKPIVYTGKYPLHIQRSYSLGKVITAVATDGARNHWIAGYLRWMINRGRHVLGVSDRISQLETLRDLLTAMGITCFVYKAKLTDKEKQFIETEARVILATRGTFRRAKNIPRLNAGIDLTPSSEPEQELGRVRRLFPDKLDPIWITPIDTAIPFLRAISTKRLSLCEQIKGVTVANL